MELVQKLEHLVEPALQQAGYALVRLLFQGDPSNPTLQVMVERIDHVPMTVDDCERISQHVSALLDVEDPISGHYTLEVTSPGIDRPLVRPEDFIRFKGQLCKLETRSMIDGRKRFKATVLGYEKPNVLFDFNGQTMSVPFDDILKAKLILTDELVASFLRKHKEEN